MAAMGPVGHVYLKKMMDDSEKQNVARRMVEKGIPVVLHLLGNGNVVWHDAWGVARSMKDICEKLSNYPEALRQEMAIDVTRLCQNENAGDFVLLGYSGRGASWTFMNERGSHAGLGVQESKGFLLTPPGVHLPAGASDFVRPNGLRAAIFHALGKKTLENPHVRTLPEFCLRVMSYNVHGCVGMDGRVSPRRIARIIEQQSPDIVALQELDHGRARSRGEDQANEIAELLGYHVVFCPTMESGTERYGHAILSRFPLETVKVALLPSLSKGVWPENRGALWTRLFYNREPIHVVSTHLGLNSAERRLQMEDLLGENWIGPLIDTHPVILCGDFNGIPGGATHRLAAKMLNDVTGKKPRPTFSSLKPIVQLDYIFTSRHFSPDNVTVIRNHLARVSSDHLPLMADLSLVRTEENVQPSMPQSKPSWSKA